MLRSITSLIIRVGISISNHSVSAMVTITLVGVRMRKGACKCRRKGSARFLKKGPTNPPPYCAIVSVGNCLCVEK